MLIVHQDHNCLPQKFSILHKQETCEITIIVLDYWQALVENDTESFKESRAKLELFKDWEGSVLEKANK